MWEVPEGLRVQPDGTWRIGELQVIHPPSLRYLKSHLVFEEQGAFLVDGGERLPLVVEGPAFVITTVVFQVDEGVARVVLDDGSEEVLEPHALSLSAMSGRFECRVRGGRARALLSRGAHQLVLQHVTEDGGGFALRVGTRSIPIRT